MNFDQEKGFKNLLIIGHTNAGKSTLCNVLCDTNDFEENDYTAKKTRSFQKKVFELNETKYRVMEIGVDSIEKKDLYNKISEAMPEGISQVLFVIDERITAENIDTINLFKCGILDYVTIVRTKFDNFKVKEKCEEDKSQVFYENEAVAKIVKSCKGIIYVNGPPINIHIKDDDDRERVENNKKIRKKSRTILLDHLEATCQERYYKLKTWDDLPFHSSLRSGKKNDKTQQITKQKGQKVQKLLNEVSNLTGSLKKNLLTIKF